MKEGYIVWNESNYGSEFFGVYKTLEKAFTQFRKVVRSKYGKCPHGDYENIQNWIIDNEIEDGGDSIKITKFYENNGKEKNETTK